MIGDKVQICNMALANLGQRAIQSLDQPNPSSVACKQRYDEARVEALSTQLWAFAKKWKTGVQVNADPMPGWTYVHKYPTEALRIFSIWQEDPAAPKIPFEVSSAMTGGGKWVHSNQESPVFIYTTDIEDVTLFDAAFSSALSWLLAAKIAMPITKSRKAQDDAYSKWSASYANAAGRTKNEQAVDRDQLSSYHSVR